MNQRIFFEFLRRKREIKIAEGGDDCGERGRKGSFRLRLNVLWRLVQRGRGSHYIAVAAVLRLLMRFSTLMRVAFSAQSGGSRVGEVAIICTITRTLFGLLPAGARGLNPQKFLYLAIDFGENNPGITQAKVSYSLIWSITRNWWGGILVRQAAL